MSEATMFFDEEFKTIAEKLVQKYPNLFAEDIDTSAIHYIRTPDIEPKWIARIRRCGHPWNKLPGASGIVYLIETANEKWQLLNDAQRALVVLHELKHVPSGGFTPDSDEYGKLVEHTVQDFLECIAAANGNPFWNDPGHGDVVNLLEENITFDTGQAMRSAVAKIIKKESETGGNVEVREV
jgi:predicted metallopeptidase